MTIHLDKRMDLIPHSVSFTHNKSAVPSYWGAADCECIMCNNTYLELLLYN